MVDNHNDIKTIAELGVHIRYLRDEVKGLSERIAEMATRKDIEDLEEKLRKEIEDNKPSNLFWGVTKVAAGVVAIGGAFGVFYAIIEAVRR